MQRKRSGKDEQQQKIGFKFPNHHFNEASAKISVEHFFLDDIDYMVIKTQNQRTKAATNEQNKMNETNLERSKKNEKLRIKEKMFKNVSGLQFY